MRDMGHARLPGHAIDPSLDQGQQVLQAGQRLLLLGGVGDAHLGQIHRPGQGIRIHRSGVAQLFLHGVQVDGDTARILADQGLEPRHQPRHGREEPGMGQLLQGDERHDLGDRDIQRIRIRHDVLHDKRACGILQQGQPLIEAAAHLVRHGAGGLPQLHGKRGVRQQPYQLGGVLHPLGNRNRHGAREHAGHLAVAEGVAEPFGHHGGHRVVHRLGHRRGELRPCIQRALHPAGAGQQLHLAGHRVEPADRIQPQVRLADGPAGQLALLGVHGAVAALAVRLLQRYGGGELDVDGPLLHGALHIVHGVQTPGGERLHHRLHLGGFGQPARILAEQLLANRLGQIRDLAPGHLTLNRSEAFDQPLPDSILVHIGLRLRAVRITSVVSIVWEVCRICTPRAVFTPKAHSNV